jgi:hypothetical protein
MKNDSKIVMYTRFCDIDYKDQNAYFALF